MIRVVCPACGREFEFSDFLAGLTVVCKNCSHRIPVPRRQTPPSSAAIQTAAGDSLAPLKPSAFPAPALPRDDAIQAASAGTPPPPAAPAMQLSEERSAVNQPVDFTPMPDWALERAQALLQTGVAVPQIEDRLIAQGLSARAAREVVDRLLEERTRQPFGSLEQYGLRSLLHRLLSGIAACACVWLGYWFFGPYAAGRTLLAMLLPLACIWFPDAIGVYASKYSFTGTSLGVFVRWCGWLVIVAYGIYWFVILINMA